jgi:hypothetical protein
MNQEKEGKWLVIVGYISVAQGPWSWLFDLLGERVEQCWSERLIERDYCLYYHLLIVGYTPYISAGSSEPSHMYSLDLVLQSCTLNG